jgi:hypothetical protein
MSRLGSTKRQKRGIPEIKEAMLQVNRQILDEKMESLYSRPIEHESSIKYDVLMSSALESMFEIFPFGFITRHHR